MSDSLDGFEADLAAYHRVVQIAVDELKDLAFSGNIERRHHLLTAVDCFIEIKTVLEGERAVKELFEPDDDEPSASRDTSSRTTHDDTHDDGHDVPDAV